MSETFLCQHPRRSTAETGNERLPGDWVEVRSFAEIRATLDEKASLEAMPFMPEMVQYCGQRFRVVKSAHKTYDPTGASDLRRMNDAVHLETRCDGSGHDGCDARCLLFWKTAWLKPAGRPGAGHSPHTRAGRRCSGPVAACHPRRGERGRRALSLPGDRNRGRNRGDTKQSSAPLF